MAFLIKGSNGAYPGSSVVDQWKRASVPATTNPATTSLEIFRITGGRVLVKLLFAEVTTLNGATATNTSVTYTPLGGSNADLASVVATADAAAGTHLFVEGDGTALIETATVKFAAVPAAAAQFFIIDSGSIYWKTSATNTGAAKWDMFYIPLDPGAKVQAIGF